MARGRPVDVETTSCSGSRAHCCGLQALTSARGNKAGTDAPDAARSPALRDGEPATVRRVSLGQVPHIRGVNSPCHPVPNDGVRVNEFWATLLRGRPKERHFALAGKVLTSPTKARALKSRGGRRVPPSNSSVRASMIPASNSPKQAAHSSLGRFPRNQSTRCDEPTSLCNQAQRKDL